MYPFFSELQEPQQTSSGVLAHNFKGIFRDQSSSRRAGRTLFRGTSGYIWNTFEKLVRYLSGTCPVQGWRGLDLGCSKPSAICLSYGRVMSVLWTCYGRVMVADDHLPKHRLRTVSGSYARYEIKRMETFYYGPPSNAVSAE